MAQVGLERSRRDRTSCRCREHDNPASTGARRAARAKAPVMSVIISLSREHVLEDRTVRRTCLIPRTMLAWHKTAVQGVLHALAALHPSREGAAIRRVCQKQPAQDPPASSRAARPACHATRTRLITSCRVGISGSSRRASSSAAISSRGRRTVTASVSTGGRPIFFMAHFLTLRLYVVI